VIKGYIPQANPLTTGIASASVFLIGQAPSRTDHESGEFYSGPAGKKLRGWLLEAGFSESDFGTIIYAAAITKCFPGRVLGSSKDRLPSKAEQKFCRSWLDAEIELINPKIMILFGGLAIQTFLSKEPLDQLIGNYFEIDGRLYLPLPHSSGASTWLNLIKHQQLLQNAIRQLHKIREEKNK
jgi:uracil-DNA glycosylase